MDTANFHHDTPQGSIYGYLGDDGLRALQFYNPESTIRPRLVRLRPNQILGWRLKRLFESYFAGQPIDFGEIPIDPSFGTAFQRAVWEVARTIRHGHTLTYGEVAERVERPGGAQAVGQALRVNPICIVVPCHRILAAGGRIGGFSPGLEWKRWLLRLEGIEGWKD